jgi:NADH-quinone oxidoreductase subunit G
MPTITIDDKVCQFEEGQSIIEVAHANEIEIPHYCYHPGLSIVANCRICLAEVWAPNPRNDNALEPIPKLLPTCQTPAGDGQVVHTTSPKAVANQKAVMEYLLVNHPLDCPVCDQAGECSLQDYAFDYGRGERRCKEEKITQPKKDIGEHVLLYGDRCIMCTRCVRFTDEITETSELMIDGRGAQEQIDVFPGRGLCNELTGNIVDICPVGAMLDKEFLFKQRVWNLQQSPSIDPITASGDNLVVEHNRGIVYRIKPRENMDINRWWITDEVRYGCDFVHAENRLTKPVIKGEPRAEDESAPAMWDDAREAFLSSLNGAGRVALYLSPMLSCEDAWLLARLVRRVDEDAIIGIADAPICGEDKEFADGYMMRAEKSPNARGVRRAVPEAMDETAFASAVQGADAIVMTGNWPQAQTIPSWLDDQTLLLIDTLHGELADRADILLPSATFAEKDGTFENCINTLQVFRGAIDPIDFCLSEGQIALDLLNLHAGNQRCKFDAETTRRSMADGGIPEMLSIPMPPRAKHVESDMPLVEI